MNAMLNELCLVMRLSGRSLNFPILLLLCVAFPPAVGQSPANGHQFKEKVPKIIFTDDMGTIANWATPPTREDIEKLVKTYAGYGVDVVSWDLVGGTLADYKSKYADLPPAILG